jgi:hypothetical protein
MDTLLIVQLSFYLAGVVLVAIVLFSVFKFFLTLVFVRKPARAASRHFIPRSVNPTDQLKTEVEIVNLLQAPPLGFVGHEGQLPDAICRKTGTPVRYCDCSRCRRIHGKVGN